MLIVEHGGKEEMWTDLNYKLDSIWKISVILWVHVKTFNKERVAKHHQ